jgi:class 3 adenylate cyclase
MSLSLHSGFLRRGESLDRAAEVGVNQEGGVSHPSEANRASDDGEHHSETEHGLSVGAGTLGGRRRRARRRDIRRHIHSAEACSLRVALAPVEEQTQTVQLDIRYARSGGAAIAYQVVGHGPTDLVFVPDYMSHLVYGWESHYWRDFYERLASFSRLILLDKRGTGLSDHGGGFPTLETRMEDVGAVLEAIGSRKTALLGANEGCSMACLFAATYPERTTALVLFQPASRGAENADEAQFWERNLAEIRDRWGTQEFSDEMLAWSAPSLAANAEDRAWFANWLRVGASPAAAYALNRAYAEMDLRDIMPAIRVPTLLLYRGDEMKNYALDVQGRIPDARLVRIPGDDAWGIFTSPEIPTEIERFLSGADEAAEPDRVLLTVLFTDLVGATTRAAELGDSAWRDLLAQHHGLIRREIARLRGREVDTAGDGLFATFDGPARAIRCADAIRSGLRDLQLDVRVGVHTGECELVGDKPAGIAVHTGARIAAAADAGEILVSSTVKDLVAGSGIAFHDRGEHTLKGVPDTWRLYVVTRL